MKPGTISVIIPLYNGEDYITEALFSVINQKGMVADEIIVVNDGSTDCGVQKVLHFDYEVTIVDQMHQGISAARNHGLEKSSGDFIAFLDADDLWTEDHLMRLMEPFRSNSDVYMVSGMVEQFANRNTDKRKILTGQKIIHGPIPGSTIIKRELFEQTGPFDSSLEIGEFFEWYCRVDYLGIQVELIDDVILKRRVHDRNTGILQKKNQKDYLRILFQHLKRNRASKD